MNIWKKSIIIAKGRMKGICAGKKALEEGIEAKISSKKD